MNSSSIQKFSRRGLSRCRRLTFILIPIFLLSSCAVGPNYKRPNVATPPAFRGGPDAAQQTSFADLPWWEIFHDDTLTGLIKESLSKNYDLAVAVTRVEQANELAAQARSQYFPTLGYSTLLSRGHNQFIYSPLSPPTGAQGFLLGIARATWEADLWGRIRRTNESARAQLLASEEARRGVMLTVVSSVSQAYFELIGLRIQLDIAKKSSESFTTTLTLVTQRVQEGVGNELQASRAAAELANASASVPEIERQIALKENQISVLLGRNPGPIETKTNSLGDIPPEVPAGLPSTLLERRPDVLAAEQAMRSANAQIGVAQAAFFPSISLSTFFGKLSSPLENITSSNTNAWSLGMSLAGPIFTGGALTAQKRQAVAAWEQTRAQYLQTALGAFRDVSDALITREKLDAIHAEQAKALQSNESALRVVSSRFTNGTVSNLDVLEANQRLYSSQLAFNQTEVNRRLIIIQLYKALGGGWNMTDAQWVAASSASAAQTPPRAKQP
jgi:outer membrane protein, multidrug efflux system